jgi:long-chain acyl-CoA synthetase
MNSTKVLKLQKSYRFRTSGTSGTPRIVGLDHGKIDREINHLANLFATRRRIVSLVPNHHIYGYLWTILLAEALKVEALTAPGRLRFGDLVVGFPGGWRKLPSSGWVPDVWAVSSGASASGTEAEHLRAIGCARWFDVYGSTETAGIGMRESPDAPFELFPWWPDSFTEAPNRLHWVGERHFFVGDRRDGAVQVSGLNVYPERVAAVLMEHPGVREAVVRKMRPEEGERLKAFIVGSATAEELLTWCEERLSKPERPTAIYLGHSLPIGNLGKPIDW